MAPCIRPDIRSTLVVLGLVTAAWSVAPPAAEAQLAVRRPTDRVLFLIPHPAQPLDSSYAVELAAEVRRRMESRLRSRIVVIPSDQIHKMLTESGYHTHAILGPADAERLARALRSDVYIEGRVSHNSGAPVVTLRMVDLGRSGLSGWVTVRGGTNTDAKAFAETVVDSLNSQLDAADEARECSERRDRGDFKGARERADRAFARYPDHPSAAMCAAVVLEATNQPIDSQIAMLERAVKGDSLLTRAWERLGRLYQQERDSLKALDAFTRQLEAKPLDRQLRLGVAAGNMTVGRYSQARDLLDEWLESNPDDEEFRQLKVRACVEGGLWICALQALSEQYRRDSALVGDTVFYATVIGAAQEVADTAAMLKWSREAVQHVPKSLAFLRALASAYVTAGMSDSAIGAYQRIIAVDPSDVATRLAAAKALIDGTKIDTLTPLDTEALTQAGRFLDQATAMSRDTSVLMNAAVLYYQPASALVQARKQIPMAVDWLEKSLRYDVLNRLTQNSNFFLGFGIMLQIFDFDQQVTERKSCALVAQEADMIARGKRAMERGAALSPEAAQRFLTQYRQFEARIPQLRQAFKC